MVERLQVIKRDGRVRLYFLHKGGYVGLVFERQLELSSPDDVGVESKLEFDILHVVLVFIVDHTNVLSVLPVLNDHASAVSTGANALLLQLPLYFSETFARTIARYQ